MNVNEISTKQELFDFIVGHLATQGERSFSELNEIGAYRGNGGLKCAIGCLIDDRFYDPYLESKPIGHPSFPSRILPRSVLKASEMDWMSTDTIYFCESFLGGIQNAHDRSSSMIELKSRLSEVANAHGLSDSAVNKIERWDNAYLRQSN